MAGKTAFFKAPSVTGFPTIPSSCLADLDTAGLCGAQVENICGWFVTKRDHKNNLKWSDFLVPKRDCFGLLHHLYSCYGNFGFRLGGSEHRIYLKGVRDLAQASSFLNHGLRSDLELVVLTSCIIYLDIGRTIDTDMSSPHEIVVRYSPQVSLIYRTEEEMDFIAFQCSGLGQRNYVTLNRRGQLIARVVCEQGPFTIAEANTLLNRYRNVVLDLAEQLKPRLDHPDPYYWLRHG